MSERKCISCGAEIEGRIDKIFCDAHCKSAHQYKKNTQKKHTLFKTIDLQLKRNRRLLMHFNKAGKSTVRKAVLLQKGFDPKYFTHYWKNKNGDVYLFCYDYGFLARIENGTDKYVLVQWQDYME